MFILAKLCGILTLVWFYFTAKTRGGPVINWSIIGLIGYWLVWWLSKLLIDGPLSGVIPKNSSMVFFVPVVLSLAACFLIRKKLIAGIPPVQS